MSFKYATCMGGSSWPTHLQSPLPGSRERALPIVDEVRVKVLPHVPLQRVGAGGGHVGGAVGCNLIENLSGRDGKAWRIGRRPGRDGEDA